MDSGDGADPSVLTMSCEELVEIDAADAITIGKHKGLGVDMVLNSLEPRSCAGKQPRLRARHFPVLLPPGIVEARGVVALQGDGEVGQVLPVAQEVVLDQPALIAQTQDEAPEAVVTVEL